MSDTVAIAGSAVILTVAYMLLGIGVARATAKMKSRDARLFDLFFWPVMLGVIAACGDVAE